MKKPVYLKYILKRHRGFLIFSMIFITLTQFLLVKVFTGVDTKPFLETIMKIMPQQFKTMMGEQFFTTLTIDGAAAFGFNHPVVLAIFIVLIISLSSRNIAGEIEKGTMELMLSFPVKRTSLVTKLWGIGIFIIFLVILSALLGSIISVMIYDDLTREFIIKLSKIGLNLWFLMVLIFSFSLMISTFEREGSKVVAKTAIVVMVFYFLDLLSTMWKAISFIKPYNIFTYYQPQKLVSGERDLLQNLPVLIVFIIIFFVISLWQFNRRDIPG